MRNIILSWALLLASSIYAAEIGSPFYPLSLLNNVENVVFYDDGKIHTNKLVISKTYQYEKCQLDFNTPTNSNIKLALADDVTIYLDENSQLKLHTFSVNLQNEGELPSLSKFSNKSYVFSLMGGAVDIINQSTNGSFILQTPRVTVSLKQGKYRIMVKDKTTIIVVLEGSAIANKVIESKEYIIEHGNFAHVSTYYSLSLKGMETLNNGKPTATTKPISPTDLEKMKVSFQELMDSRNTMLFSTINKEVVGIKLR